MTTANQLFAADQMKLLVAVLNRIIPAGGQLPAAGDPGVGDCIDGMVSRENALRRTFTEGLASIEIVASQEAEGEFQSLPDSGRDVVLQAVERQVILEHMICLLCRESQYFGNC